MILVPLFDLKFLTELAAGGVGTANRRHLQVLRLGRIVSEPIAALAGAQVGEQPRPRPM
jgi:hypothetical protein